MSSNFDTLQSGPPKVISLGLGRTGTMSLAEALNELGFGPYHKMSSMLSKKDPNLVKAWHNIGKGLANADDLRSLLDSYNSVLEWPAVVHPEEVYKAYPDAKYILTTRDPVKWEASMRQTVLPAINVLRANKNRTPYQQALMEWFEEDMLGRYHGGLLEKDTQRAIAVHNDRILKLIPTDKLLIYDVAQEWGPLCEFLGVTKPDIPFPRVNETASFRERVFPMFEDQTLK